MEFIVDAFTAYENKASHLLVPGVVTATFAINGGSNYVQSVAMSRAGNRIIAAGHDLLAFVNDDEVAAEDWLVRLVAGYRLSGAARRSDHRHE